jgi:hypothetical protein
MADRYEVPTSGPWRLSSRWIVGDGKDDAQQLAVSDFGRIVNHFDGLRMSSRFWRSAGRPHTPVADFKRIRYYVARSGVAY